MQYKVITDNKKNTTQIRIKLDSSKITEPKFGSLMLSGKYEHLIKKNENLHNSYHINFSIFYH
jgi:hypothetical protein